MALPISFSRVNAMKLKALTIASLMLTSLVKGKIPEDLVPVNIYNDSHTYPVFQGAVKEGTTDLSSPKLNSVEGLQQIGRNYYIYARDYIFVVDVDSTAVDDKQIPYKQAVEWKSNSEKIKLCMNKGQEEKDCKNFIKVFQQEPNELNATKRIIICGTYAFSPKCRIYELSENGSLENTQTNINANLICPYGPQQSITSLMTDGNLYTATTTGFYMQDPAMVRFPRTSSSKILRTPKIENAHKHDQTFLRIIDGGSSLNKIFVFLTEWAVEDEDKLIYSRVGQVCKNDDGGKYDMSSRFSSFFKARLVCSLPGQPPFYFNEMRDVSDLVALNDMYGAQHQKVIFAIMNTPGNSVPASAICAFKLDDIEDALTGPFMEQYTRESSNRVYWEMRDDYPKPHLANCDRSPRQLTNNQSIFLKKHQLMYSNASAWNFKSEANPAYQAAPLFTRTSSRHFLSALAVDTKAGLNSLYTVLFAGTDDGKVLKVLLLKDGKTVLIEERVVFNSKLCKNATSRSVKSIVLNKTNDIMVVVFENCIVKAPLCPLNGNKCSRDCIQSRDPYCAWNSERCVSIGEESASAETPALFQDVRKGNANGFPPCPLKLEQSLHDEGLKTTKLSTMSPSTVNDATSPSLTPKIVANLAGMSHAVIWVIALGGLLLGIVVGISAGYFFWKNNVSKCSSKATYDSQERKITTKSIIDESEQLSCDRRHSNTSSKSRHRNASTSSQNNSNHQRRGSQGERKRKHTQSECSQGNRSDEGAVFLNSDSTPSPESPEENPEATKLLPASGSVGSRKPNRSSKQSTGSHGDPKEVVSVTQANTQSSGHYAAADGVVAEPRVFVENGPYKGVYFEGDHNINQIISGPSVKEMRVPPKRTRSMQNPGLPMHNIPCRVSNKETHFVDHQHPRGLNRSASVQVAGTIPNQGRNGYPPNPAGFMTPQISQQNGWRPQFKEDHPLNPGMSPDNRMNPDTATQSLDRRKRKNRQRLEQTFDEGKQIGNQRKRFESEPGHHGRGQPSRMLQFQSVLPTYHEEGSEDIKLMKDKMKLNLPSQVSQQSDSRMPMPLADPKISGRLMNQPFGSHSNPGSPMHEQASHFLSSSPPMTYPKAFIPQQRNASDQNFPGSPMMPPERKISPTKSNPSTPMHEGQPLNFQDPERMRHYSGPNHVMQGPLPSPARKTEPFFPNHLPQQNPYSNRARHQSGGHRRAMAGNGVPGDSGPVATLPNGQAPVPSVMRSPG